VLKRSRSAFDVDLFRRQLRLSKTLSHSRFKQELLEAAMRPMDVRVSSRPASSVNRFTADPDNELSIEALQGMRTCINLFLQ
jgi:hypothetical protein